MRVSELKQLLSKINIATATQATVYSQIAETDEAFTFLSFSSGFDLLGFLKHDDISDISTGKVLKTSLSQEEIVNLKDTGFALGINGTFCVMTQKALIEMYTLLGLRGVTMTKPSNNRDCLIASLLGPKFSFVYSQGNHPIIIGVSMKPYKPNNYFETINDTLSKTFGYEAFNKLNITDGISINYRYRTINGITPIIVVRDRISGPRKYELEIQYDIDNYIVPLDTYSGTEYKSLIHSVLKSYPIFVKNISLLDNPIAPDLTILKESSDFLFDKAQKSNLFSTKDLIIFAKKHKISNEITAKLIKSVM